MIALLGRRILAAGPPLERLARLINQTAYWLIVGPFKPKGLKWDWTVSQVVATGWESVPIVVLISGAIGIILALQAAVQLGRVGALIYVATLVSVSITRELGPLITAIILAGRSGSAFAAEIGSMKVGEEVDALKTMGLNPIKYLVVPKTLGLVIALPCLTLMADLVAIAGGFFVGVGVLGLSFDSYLQQTVSFLTLGDVLSGLVKAVAFALIIAIVGCYQGLSVSGGAVGVGRRTTASVVTSIFLIILADCFFTVLGFMTG